MRRGFLHSSRTVVLLLLSLSGAWGFETPTLRDGFARPNQGPPPGPSWTDKIYSAPYDPSDMLVVDEGLRRSSSLGGLAGTWWSANTFGPNVAVAARFRTVTSATNATMMLALRIQQPGTADPGGYRCQFEPGAQIVRIFRFGANGGNPQISGTNPLTVANNDWIGCEAIGSTITAWLDTGSGWVAVATATDTTYQGVGYVGVRANLASMTLDDFSADTLGAGAVMRRGVPLMAE